MEFKEYKLSEIGKIYSGGTPSTKVVKYWNGKIPWITPKDLSNNSNKFIENGSRSITEEGLKNSSAFIIPKNSVLMSSRAPIGYIVMNRIEVTTNQGFKSLHTDEDICLNEYFYYWLKNNIDNIKNNANGSTFKEISGNEFSNLIIDLPSLENQNKIVKILSDIDKKIEINEKILKKLSLLSNAIFHNYLQKHRNEIIKKKLSEISRKIITGKTPSTKNENFWNGDIPFITIPDMHKDFFNVSSLRSISEKAAKNIVPKNSVLVSCIATVGLVSITMRASQTNQQINSIVIKNKYDLYYLFEFFSEKKQFMERIAGGSTTYNINKTMFENIEIPYLPENTLVEYDKEVSILFKKIKNCQVEVNKLILLKETLLPKLVKGKIDLSNIEA